MKGKKTCPSCNAVCGCRTLACPSCKADFGIADRKIGGIKNPETIVAVKSIKKRRKRKPKPERIDWKELDVGDTIKVLSGGGQRHISNEGESIAMGYKGKFTVKGIRPDGILAYSGSEGGFCFIHMGPKRQIDAGILLRPHKIVRISKRPERVPVDA